MQDEETPRQTRTRPEAEAEAQSGAGARRGRRKAARAEAEAAEAEAATSRQRRRIEKLKAELREARDAPPVVVAPVAPPARLRLRHFAVLLSFLLLVAAPSGLILWYLETRAADQFASRVGFVVHNEDVGAATDILGGAIDLTGGQTRDTDILYEFIRSQQLVRQVDESLDLRALWSKPENDPVFAVEREGTIEDLHDYWGRMVKVYYDTDTRLIELRVQAFDPDDAHAIATEIFRRSQKVINDLSAVAREDALRYAREELEKAEARLREARQALVRFRTETQIVDPSADVQGQMGLLNTLQAQLAEALIEQDLLRETSREGDPRLEQVARRIEVIRKRIAEERRSFGLADQEGDVSKFSALLAEFEALTVEREFAEKAWLAARAAYDAAVLEANRQSRYLAAYTGPTRAERAEYPERVMLWALATFLLFLAWAILTLVAYSIRDRR